MSHYHYYLSLILCFYFSLFFFLFSIKKTSLAGVEPAIFRFVVWRVSIAPQALTLLYLTLSFSLLPDDCHDYPILTLSLVGSYQVGYTRSHPNTEVKMLRACSVPLCSHRWERQVIYLFILFLFFIFSLYYVSLSLLPISDTMFLFFSLLFSLFY